MHADSDTVNVGAAWYRAPEVCLGDAAYGVGVDTWALGFVLAELVSRKLFFAGHGELPVIVNIFRLLGSPRSDGRLAQLPHYSGELSNFRPGEWSPAVEEHGDPKLLHVGRALADRAFSSLDDRGRCNEPLLAGAGVASAVWGGPR